jgi:predicted nucleotidyltransferase
MLSAAGASATLAIACYAARVEGVHVVRKEAEYTLGELARLAAGPLAAAGAERAVAFGSWARATADGYSDLDLAVVLPTTLPRPERGRLLAGLVERLPIAVDLLAYTPDEFERGLAARTGVFDAIAREGVTIYARSEA